MTDHPCKGMTKAQRETFERIAINGLPQATPKTLRALLERGLIAGVERKDRDSIGVFTWMDYHVPLSVHMQWCEWASEQEKIANAVLDGVDRVFGKPE